MTIEILISCMYEKDLLIAERLNTNTDVLIVNQCDTNQQNQKKTVSRTVRMISTTERGLSRSRNMAIRNSWADICQLSDNDQYFYSNYEEIIQTAYQNIPEADIIIFDFDDMPCRIKKYIHKLSFLELLHITSGQISFRRTSILNAGVFFDPFMGAGSGNGAQEENKFLIDCYKKKLKIYYVPQSLGRLLPADSTWFTKYDKSFFYRRGGATRRLLGFPLSVLYAFYYTMCKGDMYRNDISFFEALKATLKGCLDNPIEKQRRQQGE